VPEARTKAPSKALAQHPALSTFDGSQQGPRSPSRAQERLRRLCEHPDTATLVWDGSAWGKE